MLAELLNAFRKTITISASRESVTLACDETTITCRPVLQVAPDGRILGIGDPAPEGNNEGRAVPVFSAPVDRDVLVQFFRRGFVAAGIGPFSVRPRVTIDGMSDLRVALGADADDVIESALRDAGAESVEVMA